MRYRTLCSLTLSQLHNVEFDMRALSVISLSNGVHYALWLTVRYPPEVHVDRAFTTTSRANFGGGRGLVLARDLVLPPGAGARDAPTDEVVRS